MACASPGPCSGTDVTVVDPGAAEQDATAGWLPPLPNRWVAAWLRLPVLVRAAAPIAVMAVLWWSSSRSPSAREPNLLRALLHNGMHVVAYGTLAAACLLSLLRVGLSPGRRAGRTLASFVLAVAYGLVDELHQSFVPGRTCSVADLLTDAAGAMAALLLLRPCVGGAPVPGRRIAGMAVLCAGCVAFATFGPW